MEKTLEAIRIPSCGGDDNRITISNFSKEEFEKALSSLKMGTYYIRVVDGRLEAFPYYLPLPSPVEDKEMLPFWRKVSKHEMSYSYSLFETEPIKELANVYPSVTISSLCGYFYTPEKYKREAEKLTSYGFDCLRSRRGEDGKFWEHWYLPCLLFSKGDLKNVIDLQNDHITKIEKAVSFLGENVSFGTLNLSVQRMAMGIPGDTEY